MHLCLQTDCSYLDFMLMTSLALIPESEKEVIGAESEEEEKATGDKLDEEAMGDELEKEATVPKPEPDKKSEYERNNLQVTITHNLINSLDLHSKGLDLQSFRYQSRLDL